MNATDLQRFCGDKNSKRYNIQHPWTRDGFTWASNGSI